MKMICIVSFVVFCYLSVVQSLIISETTETSRIGQLERRTEPTSAPPFKRQETPVSDDTAVVVITVATDETCGYLSGKPGNPITCENQRPCMWATTQGIICGAIDDKEWEVYYTCYNSKEALDPRSCNDTCLGNKAYLRCTNESIPFCATYVFSPDGILDYKCSSTPPTRQSTAFFTYNGQKHANFATSTFPPFGSGPETSSAFTTPAKSSITSSSSLPSSTSPSSSPPSSSSSTNLGAIIGGAVGGFTALSLVALAIFWIIRQSRNKKNSQSMQSDSLEHDDGKPGTQIDWRSSTTTAFTWPNSASPQTGMGQATSPSALSETSQGILTPMRPPMTHEMSGESIQPQPQELEDSTIYEMGSGSNAR